MPSMSSVAMSLRTRMARRPLAASARAPSLEGYCARGHADAGGRAFGDRRAEAVRHAPAHERGKIEPVEAAQSFLAFDKAFADEIDSDLQPRPG